MFRGLDNTRCDALSCFGYVGTNSWILHNGNLVNGMKEPQIGEQARRTGHCDGQVETQKVDGWI